MLETELFFHFNVQPIDTIEESIFKYSFKKETPFKERVQELKKIQEPEAFLMRCYFLDYFHSDDQVLRLDDDGQIRDIEINKLFSKPRKRKDDEGLHFIIPNKQIILNDQYAEYYLYDISYTNIEISIDPDLLINKFKDLYHWQIDWFKHNDGYDDFKSFAEQKLNDKSFSYEKFDVSQQDLFYHADLIYIFNLFGINFDQDNILEWLKTFFDFEEWHSPLALKYYPDQLKKYQLMLYSWFDKELELRKKHFKNLNADFLPYEYRIIDDFKNTLIHEDDIKKWRYQYDKRDYPTSIFSSYKAFKLFEAYDDEEFKSADLSFIFYKMSDENDEDYRIIASKKQFMEWYRNKTVDKEPVDINIPKSRALEKESKRFTYRIIKKQIDKLYDLD